MTEEGFEALAVPAGVPPAEPTAEWVAALCDALRSARAPLLERDSADLAAGLGRVGERFLDPSDPLRSEALERLPEASALSPEMAAAVLDGMAADWTGPRLAQLLEAELDGGAVLDGFVERSAAAGRKVTAVGPALCVQVVAGSVPGVGVSALLRSLLVKAPTLLKPGRGDAVLPALFARGLAEADRAVAAALAVVYWAGGSTALEEAALARAELVAVYGSDEAVADLRARTPVTARFIAYHHRVSVGVVGREALGGDLSTVAAEVARAIALFDQRGCVSPRVIFVEEGGRASPEAFTTELARALEELEAELPSGPLAAEELSALHQTRGTAELQAGARSGWILHGGRAAWTVLYEPGPSSVAASAGPALSVGRVARVRPLPSLDHLVEALTPVAGHLQTVGVAGFADRLESLSASLGRVGAVRIASFRSVPFPPPWWHHDGRGPLMDLVRWVDLEP